MTPRPDEEFAPAKVNLALAVTGRRADGYHLLDTFVVFARSGDRLAATPRSGLELGVAGPFAGALAGESDNLVLRAANALAEAARRSGVSVPGARLELTKMLPVAAGLGGGSADAAAALRLLDRLWGLDWGSARLAELAATLGADVAMCLRARALRARGIGEVIEPLEGVPELPLVLVNPGKALSTPEVFAAREGVFSPPLPYMPECDGPGAMAAWLAGTANDLEPGATRREPEIGAILSALRARADCLLARMTGSGATCYGMFSDMPAAEKAAASLAAERPDWWVVATSAR